VTASSLGTIGDPSTLRSNGEIVLGDVKSDQDLTIVSSGGSISSGNHRVAGRRLEPGRRNQWQHRAGTLETEESINLRAGKTYASVG
jgi:hypothetical protein